MSQIEDHPLRYAMANELHARPFPAVGAPGRAAFLAIKPASNAAAKPYDGDHIASEESVWIESPTRRAIAPAGTVKGRDLLTARSPYAAAPPYPQNRQA